MQRNIVLQTIFLCSVNMIFMLLGTFFNSIVILCFWRSRKLRNSLGYFMILVLACFDLAVVISTHPLIMLSTMMWLFQKNQMFHIIYLDISITFYSFSVSSLLTMNVGRYVALTYPYFHRRVVTRWRLLMIFSVFEVLCLVQYILAHIIRMLSVHVAAVNLLGISFILLAFLNYKIFMIARRIRKAEDRMTASLQLNEINNRPISALNLKTRNNSKGTSTCLCTVPCFFVCCFPALLFHCIGLVSNPEWGVWEIANLEWSLWVRTFASMNSTFNCLVFFWKNTNLRSEAKNILKGWWHSFSGSNNVDERNNLGMP